MSETADHFLLRPEVALVGDFIAEAQDGDARLDVSFQNRVLDRTSASMSRQERRVDVEPAARREELQERRWDERAEGCREK